MFEVISTGNLSLSAIPAERLLAAGAFIAIYGLRLIFQAILLHRRDKSGESGDWGEMLLVVIPKNLLVLLVPYLIIISVETTWLFALGWIVFLSGITIRLLALHQLGPMYSLNIDIRNQHQLVESGVFAWLRHPLYFAYILDTVGIVIFLQSPPIALILIPIVTGISIRANREETVLRKAFGNTYDQYAERVSGFNPFATYVRVVRSRFLISHR